MLSSLIDSEPGILTAPSGAKFVFKDGITAKPVVSTQETPSDIVQNAATTYDDVMIEITGTPYGEWENLATLYPYSAYRFNQNIYGADAAWTIHTTSGRLFTFHRAAVTGYANLSLAPNKTLFGSGFKVTALRKDNTAWSAVNSLYTEAATAFTDYSTFDAAAALKVDAAAVWGNFAAPWSDIETEEGWEIALELGIEFRKSSRIGTIQAVFKGEKVTASCNPLNITAADILSQSVIVHPIQGSGARRGGRIASGKNLTLTGAGGSPVVTLTSASLINVEYHMGTNRHRVAALAWGAERTYTAGQPQPLFTVA
jgi:hypothetical protein